MVGGKMGMDKGARMNRSWYRADYHTAWGKSKGKGKPAGRAGKGPAVGVPALGGKGKSIMTMTRGQQFTSNVVHLMTDALGISGAEPARVWHTSLPSSASTSLQPICTSSTTFATFSLARGHMDGPTLCIR